MSGSSSSVDDLNRALALHRAGRLAEADAAYCRLLSLQPQHFDALHYYGVLRAQGGDLEGSVSLLRQALGLNGNVPLVHFHLAESLRLLERYDEALECYDRTIAMDPTFVEGQVARTRCLNEAGRWQEALAACERMLAAGNTASAELHHLRGNALLGLRRNQDALADFDRALALSAGVADVHQGRSAALAGLGRLEEALAEIERELARQPHSAEARCQYADVLMELGRVEDGLAAYQEALAINPNLVAAYYNLGNALLGLGRIEGAIAAFDSALVLKPEHVPALYNRCRALEWLDRYDEAAADCDKALALDPEFSAAATKSFLIRAKRCDWRDRGRRLDELKRLGAKGGVMDLFTLLGAFDEPELHLSAARFMAGRSRASWQGGTNAARDRLRIAYLSPNFHPHPVAHQAVELFERHDRARFETIGVCLSPGKETPIRGRLKAAFDHFVEAGNLNDYQLAQHLRSLQIDIAVDLAGYTANGRTQALAFRPAPIAVNYLGYPGTLGADYVDYIIADNIVIPEGDERFYAEKVVRLPGCFLPSDTKDRRDPVPPSRAEAGLPESGIVFCAFNNTYKITPDVFGVWMRLLGAVEGSVLWLNTQDAAAQANLRAEAEARHVAPQRLIFAPRMEERAQHLARIALADMFLDTPIYGAHSTASDMLWAGVPVITCLGRSFAARVAASELVSIGAQELVTSDLGAYERLALELARSPERRTAIRGKLSANRANSPLFDIAGLCHALESAYGTMWERHLKGQKPESFSVKIDT